MGQFNKWSSDGLSNRILKISFSVVGSLLIIVGGIVWIPLIIFGFIFIALAVMFAILGTGR